MSIEYKIHLDYLRMNQKKNYQYQFYYSFTIEYV